MDPTQRTRSPPPHSRSITAHTLTKRQRYVSTDKNKNIMKENILQFKHYRLNIFLIIFTLCLILIHKLFLSDLHYKSGLAGNAFYALGLFPVILFIGALLVIISTVAIIVFFIAVVKTIKTKKIEWLKLFFGNFASTWYFLAHHSICAGTWCMAIPKRLRKMG